MENKDILRVMDYEKMKQRTKQAIYENLKLSN